MVMVVKKPSPWFKMAETIVVEKDCIEAKVWLEITWKPVFLHGFRLAGEWQHVSRYYMDPQNTQYYGGYDLLNFRTGYSWKKFECWLNCRNAADAIYATTAEKTTYSTTYRPGPKRTFNIGVAYTFNGKN